MSVGDTNVIAHLYIAHLYRPGDLTEALSPLRRDPEWTALLLWRSELAVELGVPLGTAARDLLQAFPGATESLPEFGARGSEPPRASGSASMHAVAN